MRMENKDKILESIQLLEKQLKKKLQNMVDQQLTPIDLYEDNDENTEGVRFTINDVKMF